MKAKILDTNGKEKETIELPKCFAKTIRKDIIARVLEAKRTEQPFAPSAVAGKQHSASGIIIHRRKVWKSGYGRGRSRVPRKIMSRKGSQFTWVAAEVPNSRGGRRAHPPKVVSRINTLKVNKKEMKIALASALGATIDEKAIRERYQTLKEKKITAVPFIVESKLTSLKTKEFVDSLKKILGNELFKIAIRQKKVRAGKGKSRGRKYKKNSGLLVVIGDKEKLKFGGAEVVNSKKVNVTDLAKGGIGRLTLYTEDAIKNLGERLK